MPSISQLFSPGTLVGDRYRVEALLGQGGFGAVFRATQLNLDRPVALKVLLSQALGDDGLARFQREAEIVQRLEHPNIVRLLDFGHAGGAAGALGAQPFLVFELLQGRTVEEALREGGPMPPARAARIATQVLKALMEAHARGVVHRDVKPANVFLCSFQGEPDFVKVLDFGIAKGGGGGGTLTQRGDVIGTPAYMAPEQVDGREAGFATDLFALGLLIEEMLTGRAVFAGASLVDIVREHLSPSMVPHAPEALQSSLGPVIHRATQKAPERRYPSAAEMLAHVEAVVAYTMPGAVALPSAPPSGAPPAGTTEARAHAPTAQPLSLPLSPAGPRVPPPPPARARRKGAGGRPWALIGALGGGAALLGGALVAVFAARSGPARSDGGADPPAGGSAAPGSGAESKLTWCDTRHDGALVEAQVNGDGVPDLVGFCVAPTTSLCAVDGATLRVVWHRPVTAPVGESSEVRLVAAGRVLAMADTLGVLHLHDTATGAEQAAVRLGSRVEHLCAPAELPGKLWIRFRDNRTKTIDLATHALADAPRPLSCKRRRREKGCYSSVDAHACPDDLVRPEPATMAVSDVFADGASGVVIGGRLSDRSVPMIAGFTASPGAAPGKVPVRWERPVGPGDGLGALGTTLYLEIAGGRAVAVYKDATRQDHLVAIDAASGRTLWDVVSPDLFEVVLTPTRLYVDLRDQIDVRDAATGQLLGTVGDGSRSIWGPSRRGGGGG